MGVYLARPEKSKHSQEGQISEFKYACSEMQGMNNMEDATIVSINVIENLHIFGIFDGHGGKDVSAFCKENFINLLKQNENFKEKKFEKALKEGFLAIDVELKKLEKEDNELIGGCTAVVALIYQNYLYVASSGDSRALIYSNGRPIALTQDHKPELKKEKDRIEKGGAQILDGRVNGNLNLSRALGDLMYKKNPKLSPEEQIISYEPDISKVKLTSDDEFLLLGCDGIFECLPNDAICDYISSQLAQSDSLKSCLESLLDKIIAPDTTFNGVGCDNMSTILIQFNIN